MAGIFKRALSGRTRGLTGIDAQKTTSSMKVGPQDKKVGGGKDTRSPKANRGKGQRYKPGYKPNTPLGGM